MKHSRHNKLYGTIDWPVFGSLLQAEIDAAGLGLRGLADDLDGPSSATLSRTARGKPCSVEMYLWLCAELEIDPWAAFRRRTYG